jgi:hypothetical protein
VRRKSRCYGHRQVWWPPKQHESAGKFKRSKLNVNRFQSVLSHISTFAISIGGNPMSFHYRVHSPYQPTSVIGIWRLWTHPLPSDLPIGAPQQLALPHDGCWTVDNLFISPRLHMMPLKDVASISPEVHPTVQIHLLVPVSGGLPQIHWCCS